MFKLGIIQDYIPYYRVRFFQLLKDRLLDEQIELKVLADLPLGPQGARRDKAELAIQDKFAQINFRVGQVNFVFPKNVSKFDSYDALIGPLRGSSFSTNLMILHCLKYKKSFGLWGHVGSYVNYGNKIDLWVEKKQMQLSTSIFSYTESGKDFAVRQGINPEKIFVLNNTFDYSELNYETTKLTDLEMINFIKKYQLIPNKTLLFMGGIDASKRIDFLVSSLDLIWLIDPTIKLLILGNGLDQQLLQSAIIRGQVHILNSKSQKDKAMAGQISKLILMPGRIGLISVDAHILGIPIVTTDFSFHAPEFEYLVENVSKFTSKENTPQSYSQLILDLINANETLRFKGNPPSIEQMVDSFCKGSIKLRRRRVD